METRTSKVELKQEGRTVSGYAVVFDTPATITERGKTFTEVVRAGSLRIAPDLRLLWSHEPGNVLASSQGGTLTVKADSHGLYFTADLPESATREKEALARGDVNAMSFGFFVNRDKWTGDKRELLDVDVREISIVAYPAYPGTSANLRSKNEMKLRLAEKMLE